MGDGKSLVDVCFWQCQNRFDFLLLVNRMCLSYHVAFGNKLAHSFSRSVIIIRQIFCQTFSWNISPMFYLLAGFFPNEVPYNGWCFFILNLVRFCLVSSVQAKKYLLPCLSRMVFNMEFFQNHLFYYLRTFTMGWFMYIVYILLFKFKYLMF